jgi:hypothetical protein
VQRAVRGGGGFSACNMGFGGWGVRLWVMRGAGGVFGGGCWGAAVGLMRRNGRG